MLWHYLIGYLYAVWLGHIFTSPSIKYMWKFLDVKHSKGGHFREGKGRYSHQPYIVGLIERTLYYFAFLAEIPAFVGIWFTLKTIVKSPRWTGESKSDKENNNLIPGRALFQPFLAGNGLSLIFSAAGYALTTILIGLDMFPESTFWLIAFIPIALSLYSFGVAYSAWYKVNKDAKKANNKVWRAH